MAGDRIVYFAYGSNLHPGWLGRRVPSARVLGPASLPGHRLAFRKLGRDGSAKSDAEAAPGASLPGAVYEMSAAHLGRLGAAEGGYLRVAVQVRTGAGVREAFAYVARAENHVTGLAPWDWYVALIRRGAEIHGLPESHREWLAGVATAPDPDEARARLALDVLRSGA